MHWNYLFVLIALLPLIAAKKFNDETKPDWAKKDIRDFTDADMERLLDQWEVNIKLTKYLVNKHSTACFCRKMKIH